MLMNVRSGFTIVEVIVVTVVISILATITVVAYNGMQDRAYMSQLRSTVETYTKVLKMYWVDHGEFPNYGNTWGTCLGKVSDYPAENGFPVGACTYETNGNYTNIASDAFYNSLSGYLKSPLPSGKIRTASEGDVHYRGIYYEHQNNPTGSGYPDWAYLEYISQGNYNCGDADYTRYDSGSNVTFCGYLIYADGN